MSNTQIPVPDKMTLKGNATENWKYFKSEWKFYQVASDLSAKPVEVQLATFMVLLGRETWQILENMKLADNEKDTVAKVIEELDKFFIPQINVIYERYVFGSATQEISESVDEYVAKLRKLSTNCNYKTFESEMIRDRLVLGIRDESTKKQLISDPKLTLETAINVCRVNELADTQMKYIRGETETQDINRIDLHRKKKQCHKNTKQVPCKYCGKIHPHDRLSCPAYNKICNFCKTPNHFASVCQSKQQQENSKRYIRKNNGKHSSYNRRADVRHLSEETESEDSSSYHSNEAFAIEEIRQFGNSKQKKIWTAFLNFLVDDHNQVCTKRKIKCQLDSGSGVDAIEESNLKALYGGLMPKLDPPTTRLRSYGGAILKPLGEISLNIEKRNNKHTLRFVVIHDFDHPGTKMPLLSSVTREELGFVELQNGARAETIDVAKLEESNKSESILAKYEDVFKGVGCLQGECKLSVDPAFPPVKQAPRRIPVPLRNELKLKLQEMEKNMIIKKETGPSDWISNIVLVKTPRKLRICIDPKDLNKALKRTEYEIPTIESIVPELNHSRFFTVLDTKDEFWNLKLEEESSKLTTFWTPFGRYRWLRLPFGLKVSTDIYQCRLHEVFAGIPDIVIVQDDILILGRGATDEEASTNHDHALKRVLATTKAANLKFNKSKVLLKKRQVKYMGHIITKDGLKADPEKVRAIKEMPDPADVSELNSFIGLATYMSKFVPNLSSICKPLYDLTKKDQQWKWNDEHRSAVEEVKKRIMDTQVLAFFNQKEPAIIQADASSKGLGAVLIQQGPVAFASRSLSPNEKNWAQIERECLSILFACQRFEQYIVGCKEVIVQTDHPPLEVIFKRSIMQAPTRLQRMLLRLQRYNLCVQFLRGKDMLIADALSRMQLPDDNEQQLEEVYRFDSIFEELESIKLAQNLNIMPESLRRIREETCVDNTLCIFLSVIKSGWPENKNKLPPCLYEFWNYKHELMVQDGVIYKGSQIVVPKSLRADFITKIHQCHLGQNASLRRARDTLFWPFMSSEIKDVIKSCPTCQEMAAAQPKQPMTSHRIPSLPWERVNLDTFEFDSQQYIVMVDSYSDYFEVEKIPNTKAETINAFCKRNFARHGIPLVLVTDNATALVGKEFTAFAKKWEFYHSTSAPYNSRRNGKAESSVKIAKNILKKCKRDEIDFQAALLEWRNIPTEGMESSPVQCLMSRRTRTTIPVAHQLLAPEVVKDVQGMIELKRERSKFHHDKRAKVLPELRIGQEVYVKPQEAGKNWLLGRIVNQDGLSYQVSVNDKVYRRDRFWLKPAHRVLSPPPPKCVSMKQSTRSESPSPLPESLIKSPKSTKPISCKALKGRENQPVSSKSLKMEQQNQAAVMMKSHVQTSSPRTGQIKTSSFGRPIKPPRHFELIE